MPDIAEGIARAVARSQSPQLAQQFNGLLGHLKQRTCDEDDRTKYAILRDCMALLPTPSKTPLRILFTRVCIFGDPTNTESMNSAKWMKLLRHCGIVALSDHIGDITERKVSAAEADVVFCKVVCDCTVEGKPVLDFERFATALMVLSGKMWPTLDDAEAFQKLVVMLLASPMEAWGRAHGLQNGVTPLHLDLQALSTLRHHGRALASLFHAFSGKDLHRSAKTTWGSRVRSPSDRSTKSTSVGSTMSDCENASSLIGSSSCRSLGFRGSSSARTSGSPSASADRGETSSCSGLSFGEFVAMCSCLRVPPEQFSRAEAADVFKRAQSRTEEGGLTGSMHSVLPLTEFVHAMGLAALTAFGKSPYAEMHVQPHERIEAFIVKYLPKNSFGVGEISAAGVRHGVAPLFAKRSTSADLRSFQ